MAPITFTEADTALIVALINQLDLSTIDKGRLQVDLGLPTLNATGMRLTRFKQKIAKGLEAGGTPEAEGADGEAGTSPTKPAPKAKKVATPRKRKTAAEKSAEAGEAGVEDGESPIKKPRKAAATARKPRVNKKKAEEAAKEAVKADEEVKQSIERDVEGDGGLAVEDEEEVVDEEGLIEG